MKSIILKMLRGFERWGDCERYLGTLKSSLLWKAKSLPCHPSGSLALIL